MLHLSESKSLDGGGLRVWIGAAAHAVAALPRAPPTDGIFAAVSSGGERQLSGAYLRAALKTCVDAAPGADESRPRRVGRF